MVGVIVSPALFLIANVAYRTGATGPFLSQLDVAELALQRYKLGVMAVIAGCEPAGWALRSAGWA